MLSNLPKLVSGFYSDFGESFPISLLHAIEFAKTGFRIPLGLWGVFSYFPFSKLTVEFLRDCGDVYLLTPTNWDPHQIDYSQHEDRMMDWKGNVTGKSETRLILLDVPDLSPMILAMQVSSVETARMNLVLDEQNNNNKPIQPTFCQVPSGCNKVSSLLADVSPALDDTLFFHCLNE